MSRTADRNPLHTSTAKERAGERNFPENPKAFLRSKRQHSRTFGDKRPRPTPQTARRHHLGRASYRAPQGRSTVWTFDGDEGTKERRILLCRIRCGSLERLKGDHTGIRTREASTTKHLAERRNCIPSAQAFIQTDGTPSGFKAAMGIPRVAIPLSQDRNPGLR
jgi:hypothetical protein